MRRYAIFGNWKMNKTLPEARALAQSLKSELSEASNHEIAVFPPAPFIEPVLRELHGSRIGVGSQNIHFEPSGPFTGEMSAQMVGSLGASYTLVGHSERRRLFGDTKEWVNLKLMAALSAGLVPVVCVGETLSEREAGATEQVVGDQVRAAFEGVQGPQAAGVIVAYEPLWAIGTGKTATPQQAQEMHEFIRSLLAGLFGRETAAAMRILYGGSVKPGNAAELLEQADIDGALVGGASLDAASFAAIVRAAPDAQGLQKG